MGKGLITMFALRKSSWLIFAIGALGINGLAFVIMLQQIKVEKMLGNPISTKMLLMDGFILLFLTAMIGWYIYKKDRHQRIEKALNDGFIEVQQNDQGTILIRHKDKGRYEIAQYDQRGYCMDHKIYYEKDLSNVQLIQTNI